MTGRLFRRSGQLVELSPGGVNRSRVTVSLLPRVSRIIQSGVSNFLVFTNVKGV